MRLAEPGWLFLLILTPLPWVWAWSRPRLLWPTLQGFAKAPRGAAGVLAQVPLVARAAALVCMVVALARPQSVGGQTRVASRGVAIVVALDRSGSMDTADFAGSDQAEPITRLAAARRTFVDFVRGRPDDLIGLVVFANEPDTACAPTLDHRALLEAAQAIRPARAGEDGTNLGDAVAWGLDALRSTTPRAKVLIVLTDGENRPGVADPPPLDPEAAARLAGDLGVRLHTIALGGPSGPASQPAATEAPSIPDAEGPNLQLLRRMAELGGGRALVANDLKTLDSVFRELDALEKSPVTGRVHTRYREEFAPWVASALVLLTVDLLLSVTRLRRLP